MAVTADVPYRPYQPGPFRWRLGLRPLDLAQWIEVDAGRDADLAEKRRVLAAHHATVVAVLPEPDAAHDESLEVLELLVDHLVEHHHDLVGDLTVPAALRPDGVGADLHPLDAAGRLVQEDLALLVERDGRLVFGAGSVCFPNRWDLPSKIGRSMAEVHAPVARLNDELGEPIDRFFERLRPDRSYWRLGWGVLDTAELYQPLDGTAPPRPPRPSVSDLHLRVERETLRRLPRTGGILFTIRTHLAPVTALAADPAEADRLAAALDALPADVADYKQLGDLGPQTTTWLRSRGVPCQKS